MGMTFDITEMQDILVVSIDGNPRVDDRSRGVAA